MDGEGNPIIVRVTTTPGRMLLSEILPRHKNVPFRVINQQLTKKEITNVIDVVYRHCGQKETVIFCDRMMALGFTRAFKAGISFGKDDMVVPSSKLKHIDDTKKLVGEYEQQYQDGLITQARSTTRWSMPYRSAPIASPTR